MPQSDTQALVWYHKSAKQGHVYSLYALGTMYENGKGVDQSYTQALGWYRKAAQSGYDRAEYKLGGIYYYGRGTARSKSTAIDWYKKASASGSHKAAQVLERLKGTTEKHTGKDDTPIYVIPDDVAKSAAAIFDLVQEDGIFNEQNARDLMAIYLEVDKLSNNEKQTLLALSKSTNASVKYQSGTVANRTVQAQYIMNLIVRPENLNEFWFKGDDGMRHLVNMASVAPVVDSRVINFVGSKFWTEWQESSISNGYGPVRDVIAKMYTECEKLSPQQKRTCSQLAYKAMVRVQDHVKKPGSKRIPIFIYNWLERAPQD